MINENQSNWTNQEYLYQINNKDFLFCLSYSNSHLTIVLETPNETNYWRGNWKANDLEEMTRKAKSHKSFEVFTKMLISGLTKESDIVKLDLLNYSDLEKMKQNKSNLNSSNATNNMNTSTTTETSSKSNDKFLIVKYMTDFEYSQYPLRLNYMDELDISLLTKTISRLRKNLIKGKNSGVTQSISNIDISDYDGKLLKEVDELKYENTQLKGKLKLIESHRQSGAVENDEYIKSVSTIKVEYDNYKGHTENKLKLLCKTIEELKGKLSSKEENMNSTHQKHDENLKNKIHDLEEKNQKLSELIVNERNKGKEYIDNQNVEYVNTVKELQFMKENERKLKVKITQLEKDLEQANKQMKYATYGSLKGDKNSKTGTPKSNYSYKNYSVKSGNYSVGKNSVYSGRSGGSYYSGKASRGPASNYSGSSAGGSKNSYNMVRKNPFDKKVDLKGLNSKKYSEYKVKASPNYSRTSDNRSTSNSKKSYGYSSNNKTQAVRSKYNPPPKSISSKNPVSSIYKKPTGSTSVGASKRNNQTYATSNKPKMNNFMTGDTSGTTGTDVASRLEKLGHLINKVKK